MTQVIDAKGRWILTDEPCRFCGTPSDLMHPAGVVSGRWTCTRCGRKQNDVDRGCVVCGKPGVGLQRVWPDDPHSLGMDDGHLAWLCEEHLVPDAYIHLPGPGDGEP